MGRAGSTVTGRCLCGAVTCGTSLYWRQVGTHTSAISAPALDDQARLRLTEQIFIDEKPAYYDFANDTPRLTGAEVLAAFQAKREADNG